MSSPGSTSPGLHTPEQVWAAYLDAVEAAARDVERQVLAHGQVTLTPLPKPDAPWPAGLEVRRHAVLAVLAGVATTLERRRAETAAALAALARPAVRPTGGYTDGTSLDVVG